MSDSSISPPSFSFAKRNGITLTGWQDGNACVAHRHNIQPLALLEMRRYLKAPMQLEAMASEDFDILLERLYQSGADEAMQIAADIGGEMDLKQIADDLPEPDDLLESQDDAPIIKLINALLTEAINQNASDIHVEPFENRLAIRFRVDGVLREVLTPERRLASLIVSRIKVMAHLDIAEKRIPQDGRISLKIAGRPVDVRVSTLPSGQGERVVLRLLDKQAGRLDLSQLGMEAATKRQLNTLIKRPHGILLVTGPTGSGKTTTLYATLTQLNDRTRNIMTVEDPIEYYIDGIGQTQVNNKVDMNFARGLRAILRQDPDVVLVGEIRDLETAQIAVQASLTGHMVLSTLHTNSAVGAITRLRNMGIEPFLLSSSLIGVLAQRLVRVLCGHCKKSYTARPIDGDRFGQKFSATSAPTLHKPEGCDQCRGSGFNGRTGIYELITLDDTQRDMIHENASEQQLEAQARKTSRNISFDGWRKVLAGVTSVDEVLRVTREENTTTT